MTRPVRGAVLLAFAATWPAAAWPAAAWPSAALVAQSTVHEGRAILTVVWSGAEPDLARDALLEWVRRSAAIVGGNYGEFPVDRVRIEVRVTERDQMGPGRSFGAAGPRIEIAVGRHVTAEQLEDDWVLVHEMIHLAVPAIADAHNWLAEGLSTYVEGIARVQAGNLGEAALWSEYVHAIPKGLPEAGDQGLDRTHTWARTYWGGALYCLLADVRIREQTAGRRGLQDALRAISRAGAGMAATWPVERIFALGDAATGTSVMEELYREMKDRPVTPDLEALWAKLGIRGSGDRLYFDDSAPLAAVRRAITRPER